MSEQSESMIAEFGEFLIKVIAFSSLKSTILSSGANKILNVLSQVNIRALSVEGVINEFERMLPALMNRYREITTDLTLTIGNDLVNAVNNALTGAETTFQRFIKIFRGNGNCFNKDADYKPALTAVKKLIDTIELRGDVTLSESQLAIQKVQNALLVLRTFLKHIKICTQGLSICSRVVLLEQKSNRSC